MRLARLDWSLEDKPNIVILCLGANDMLRGLDPKLTKQNLNHMIKKMFQILNFIMKQTCTTIPVPQAKKMFNI